MGGDEVLVVWMLPHYLEEFAHGTGVKVALWFINDDDSWVPCSENNIEHSKHLTNTGTTLL